MGPILVMMENGETGFTESSRELIGKARELATQLGVASVAVGFGPSAEDHLRHLGVDRVIAVADPALSQYNPLSYETVLSRIIEQVQPYVTLMSNTTLGLDLGAGVAAQENLPLIAYCSDLAINGDELVATCQVFAGKLMAEIRVPDQGAVITVMPGAWAAYNEPGDPEREVLSVDVPQTMKVLQTIEPEKGDVDITKADILVSVGRGIESPDNLPLAEELAEAIGGVVSCSRPVVDAGWLPKARQVGKSGQTVKPKLYLALGISGAPEHLQGMRDADLIIAVNTDENASIMDVAHYGTTVDMLELMPVLAERLRGE
ncbi:electron transfer flavoprotein subunit alpha/FixB family protein [Sulfobacillus thermosulfidooxidans]|uniref:electron transfer flavoprotein subunit alpha/FixB family protein n=1 Tax=Sulfobacillus thermosulfidooxidans TaxID=28034 RepID=UPI00096B8741|nr:electron transfer flavoprotein subunit alpha/FixB family protein [Sulfobacillus thermosulfidooxidans]OLZ12168.1 electron transfer flavoprotein subunit alpha [Sulfobacillus thermosulfidooxidans]OLZ13052.1 electron transfer flavoprotein subunit alpha [Sulfobacillus thermosulfidooxidans]OLZ21432.1 electron transfer flavoprotein subunit alpha [Sulfobacillus thermosulfidooxidans]